MDGRRRVMRVIIAVIGAALLVVAGPSSAQQAGQQQVPSGSSSGSQLLRHHHHLNESQQAPTTPTPAPTSTPSRTRPSGSGVGELATSASEMNSRFASEGEQHKQQRNVQANRWTQFGARLRPLASVGPQQDHAESASNPNALTAYAHQAQASDAPPAGPAPDEEADEADGPQDGEALLYRMMQQQGFLGAPAAPSRAQPAPKQRPASSADRDDNRRVIKLLKSYSHIHQVDDSDDQIRGSGNWRPSVAASGKWRQQQQQQQQPSRRHEPSNRANYQPQESAEQNQDGPDGSSHHQHHHQQQQPPSGAQQEEDEFECPNNGIFADEPSGCQYYHVCQSGAQVQQKFQCPMGTLFNNVILTCDFAHNVQCSKQARRREQQQQQLAAPRVMSSQQQQPRPWQRPQQRLSGSDPIGSTSYQVQQRPRPSGPRPLQIGSAGFSGSSNQLDGGEEQDEGSNQQQQDDDDSPAPLVPARLPYNPPPKPELAQSSRNYHQQQQQRPQYLMNPFADYSDDGTSSINAPVHAGPLTSGLHVTQMASSTAPSVTAAATTTPVSSSFNLMIDHQVASSPKVSLVATSKPALSEASQAPRQQQQLQTRPSAAPPSKPKVDSVHQVIGPKYGAKRQQQPQQSIVQKSSNSRQQQQQQLSGSYLVSSSQQRPYQQHAVVVQQQQAKPALVDLTNSQQGPGVASSALQNDGLLLLLRHSGANYQTQASSQAYALDPQLVRPNSLDAHLFPNVQSTLGHGARVAASSQPTPVRIAPPSQPQTLIKAKIQQHTAKPRVVAAPNLPPMEPPKPQELIVSSKGVGTNHQVAGKDELHFQAAASAPASHAQTVALPAIEKQKAAAAKATKPVAAGNSTTRPTPTTTIPTTTAKTPTAKPTKRAVQNLKRTLKRTKLVEKLPPKKANNNISKSTTTITANSTLANTTTTTRQLQQQVRANSR